tara:strand:+ start:82 stop:468 length:387 start_codon:yes stop_codon:yes gene_type:complete
MTSEEDVDEITKRMTESSREKLKEQREESEEERKKREAQEWLEANPRLARSVSFANALRNKRYHTTGKGGKSTVKLWKSSGHFVNKDNTETLWQAKEKQEKQFWTKGSTSEHDRKGVLEPINYLDEEE